MWAVAIGNAVPCIARRVVGRVDCDAQPPVHGLLEGVVQHVGALAGGHAFYGVVLEDPCAVVLTAVAEHLVKRDELADGPHVVAAGTRACGPVEAGHVLRDAPQRR